MLSWVRPAAPHRVVLRYEELAAVERALAAVMPHLRPLAGRRIPSFDELRRTDDRFFRRARTGSHRAEMPSELHARFLSREDDAAPLRLLG